VRSDRLRAPFSYASLQSGGGSASTSPIEVVDTVRVSQSGSAKEQVCDENGAVEAEICCSASTPGYAMKQDAEADIVRSYTPKATTSCNFHLPTYQSEHLHTMSHGNTEWIDPYATEKSFEVSDSSRRYS
jgi:hypothetical protein